MFGPSLAGGGRNDLKLLAETIIAAPVAAVDFTAFDPALYRAYQFVFDRVLPAVDSDNFLVQFSADGGATFDPANYLTEYLRGESGLVTAGRTTSSLNMISVIGSSAVLGGIFGEALIIGAGDAAYTHFSARTWSYRNATTDYIAFVGGYHKVAQVVDGVRFQMVSGNIASGKIAMYGVR